MRIDGEFILFDEVDEMLIKEVDSLVYNAKNLERISRVEWTVVDFLGENNHMSVCVYSY